MSENIQIKKLYYSPIKSFNFIESKSLKIIKNIGIENDCIFAFVRNKTKEEAIKFQEKQYLRNNQIYLSVKNTPIFNHYRLEFQNQNLKVFLKNKKKLSQFQILILKIYNKLQMKLKNEKLI